MAATGFHSEWITIDQHRILLECRASFPDDMMRFMAKVAAVTCDCNSENGAKVVQIFYDDKASIYMVDIASTDPADERLPDLLNSVMHTMTGYGNWQSQISILEEGNTESDHYNLTEHLSVKSGIAVDRWRHRDEKYMASTHPPR